MGCSELKCGRDKLASVLPKEVRIDHRGGTITEEVSKVCDSSVCLGV